jgi:hypothetical protein
MKRIHRYGCRCKLPGNERLKDKTEGSTRLTVKPWSVKGEFVQSETVVVYYKR